MDNNMHENHAIHCTVTQCAHHCRFCDYCSLDSVSIGTHEIDPTVPECVDCNSFRVKG